MTRSPPCFRSVPEPSAYVGEAIAYRDGLIVEDNCCGEVRIDVDTSAVNPNAAGDYPIIYTATDVSGNRSTAKSTVHIGASRISQESLNRKIDEIIAANITANATIETQLREVYAYIQSHIRYAASEDTSDRVRIAYGVAGPVPMRAPSAEAVVNGQPVTMENVEAFSKAVLEDINPRDSWRASKAFRKHIAVEMAKRALIESVKRCGGEI